MRSLGGRRVATLPRKDLPDDAQNYQRELNSAGSPLISVPLEWKALFFDATDSKDTHHLKKGGILI